MHVASTTPPCGIAYCNDAVRDSRLHDLLQRFYLRIYFVYKVQSNMVFFQAPPAGHISVIPTISIFLNEYNDDTISDHVGYTICHRLSDSIALHRRTNCAL